MDAILRSGAVLGEAKPPFELVNLKGVHKHYRGAPAKSAAHALHDIHLQVTAGEMVAICGPAGSGKTSLLNVIGMLSPATEGSVVIDRLLVAKLSEQARADLRCELIGFVFQTFSLIPVLTVLENVMLPLMLRGRLGTAAHLTLQARAADLLARLGLATCSGQYPARLDAGQCQRAAIARALIAQPRLVIADEPASRLDHGSARLVMDLFARQQREHGTAFVISTSDQRQFGRATRTLQLNEGRLQHGGADGARQPLRVQS
jgi:putative ABC transport system ATP-binding protein